MQASPQHAPKCCFTAKCPLSPRPAYRACTKFLICASASHSLRLFTLIQALRARMHINVFLFATHDFNPNQSHKRQPAPQTYRKKTTGIPRRKVCSNMAPTEALRYKDARGDTIIIKFDADLLPSLLPKAPPTIGKKIRPKTILFPRNTPYVPFKPDKSDPSARFPSTEMPGPISMYHEWHQETVKRENFYSLLLDVEGAIERYDRDKKPVCGFILWEGTVKREKGAKMQVRVRWMGFRESELGCSIEIVG